MSIPFPRSQVIKKSVISGINHILLIKVDIFLEPITAHVCGGVIANEDISALLFRKRTRTSQK